MYLIHININLFNLFERTEQVVLKLNFMAILYLNLLNRKHFYLH